MKSCTCSNLKGQMTIPEYEAAPILRTGLGEILELAGGFYLDFLTDMCRRFAKAGLNFEKIKRAHGGAALGTGMVLIPLIMSPQGQQQAPTVPLIICPKCHAYVPATSKFCPECGTSLRPPTPGTVKCPKCGHSIPASSKFCPECGAKMLQETY
jgi:RNA polymerase subunit RPABC4/transcription elongation factor Spt4